MAGAQITVTLPPELEAFIEERAAAGRFATAGEAVREGLRLLEEREQERESVLTELRQKIEIGVEQAKTQDPLGVMSEFVLTQAAEGDLLKIIEYLEGDNPDAVLKIGRRCAGRGHAAARREVRDRLVQDVLRECSRELSSDHRELVRRPS